MTKSSVFSVITILGSLLALTACGGSNGFVVASQKEAVVTDKNITPQNTYKISQTNTLIGFLTLQKAEFKIDKLEGRYTLTGHYSLVNATGAEISADDVELSGTVAEKGATSLFPIVGDKSANEKARARVTCLTNDAQGFCQDVIVDFYVKKEGETYATQVQIDLTPGQTQPGTGEVKPSTSEDKTNTTKNDSVTKDEDQAPYESKDDEAHDGTEEGEEGGLYVGTLYDDPAPLFESHPVTPEPPHKNPKKDETGGPAGSASPSPSTPTTPVNPDPTKPGPVKPAPTTPPQPAAPGPVAPSSPGTPATPTTPKPTTLPPPHPTDATGTRPRDQAIGMAANGRMENSTSLKEMISKARISPVRVLYSDRNRFYGTYDLVQDIQNMGNYLNQIAPGNRLTVGDLSQKNGGKLLGSAHKSHQNGLDADIAYPQTNTKTPSFIQMVATDGHVLPTMRLLDIYRLFEYVQSSLGAVDRIFVHPKIKAALCEQALTKGLLDDQGKGRAMEVLRRLRPESSHGNHFHMRIRCPLQQPRCRMMAEPPSGSGCNSI